VDTSERGATRRKVGSKRNTVGCLHTVLKDKDLGVKKEVRGRASTAARLLGHVTKYGRGNEFLSTSFGIRCKDVCGIPQTMLVGRTTVITVVWPDPNERDTAICSLASNRDIASF
jgi:hypothetical protein